MTFSDEDAKWAYECIQNEIANDAKVQKELRQVMTESNKELSNRLGDIEAQSLGLQEDGMGNLTDIGSGATASEEMAEQYKANHEQAILNVPHETFTDNNMQYKDGKIIPIDHKAVKKQQLVSTGSK
jgi:hypothetical protein|tara:strand:- start:1477 stop:1857 length:381 start_codon:yes stop_codon:yes gene_type:complete